MPSLRFSRDFEHLTAREQRQLRLRSTHQLERRIENLNDIQQARGGRLRIIDYERRAFMQYLIRLRTQPTSDINRMEQQAELAARHRNRERRQQLQEEEEEAVAVAEAAIRLRNTAPVRRPRSRVVYNEGIPMYPDQDANFFNGNGADWWNVFVPPALGPPIPWQPAIPIPDEEELRLRALEEADLVQQIGGGAQAPMRFDDDGDSYFSF